MTTSKNAFIDAYGIDLNDDLYGQFAPPEPQNSRAQFDVPRQPAQPSPPPVAPRQHRFDAPQNRQAIRPPHFRVRASEPETPVVDWADMSVIDVGAGWSSQQAVDDDAAVEVEQQLPFTPQLPAKPTAAAETTPQPIPIVEAAPQPTPVVETISEPAAVAASSVEPSTPAPIPTPVAQPQEEVAQAAPVAAAPVAATPVAATPVAATPVAANPVAATPAAATPVAATPAAATPAAAAPVTESVVESETPIAANVEEKTAESVSLPTMTPVVPAWEVDRFAWSQDIEALFEEQSDYFAHAGRKLLAASHEGLSKLAIISARPGEGTTTMTLCLARAIAAAGGRVAVLDGNLRNSEIGRALSLEFASGWQVAAAGAVELAEAAIAGLAEKITLFPAAAAADGVQGLADESVRSVLQRAAAGVDLLLIDAGQDDFGDNATEIDAAMVVRDVRRTSEQQSVAVALRLREAGVKAVGIAENFSQPHEAAAAA